MFGIEIFPRDCNVDRVGSDRYSSRDGFIFVVAVCAQDNFRELLISPISYILLASLSFFLQTYFGFIFPIIVFYINKFDLHLLCHQVYAVDASNIAVQVLCWINFKLLLAEYGA